VLFEVKIVFYWTLQAVSVKHQSSSEFCATLYTDTGFICLLKFIIGFVAVSDHLCKIVIELLSVLQLYYYYYYYYIFRKVQHKKHYVFRNLGIRLSKTYLESQSVVKMAED
jgi:hypothetical protein